MPSSSPWSCRSRTSASRNGVPVIANRDEHATVPERARRRAERGRRRATATLNPATTAADRVDGATWRIAATVTLGAIMTSVDTTVVNVALDDLTHDFGASVAGVQWVATGYLLALAIVMPLSGWATDRFGGKRVWAASIALFLAGSMLAGAAWSLGSLPACSSCWDRCSARSSVACWSSTRAGAGSSTSTCRSAWWRSLR